MSAALFFAGILPMKEKPIHSESPPSPPVGGRSLVRLLGGPALVILLLIVFGRAAGGYWPQVQETVAGLGTWGYAVFVAAWIVLATACFPVSVLGFSAGLLFEPVLAFGLVLMSGLLSGSLMFWLGRALLRQRIRELVSTRPRLAAVDRLAGRKALRLNILTRLSPLNYGLACYTLASGRTAFGTYFLGMFGLVPSAIAQIWFGNIARQAGQAAAGEGGWTTAKTGILIGGLAFFTLLTWIVGRMIRDAWAEEADESLE